MSCKAEANRKDEFLAILAHELRNPLAPISNALQILKLRSVDAATRGGSARGGRAAADASDAAGG